jgi:hypothetical protein
MIYGHNVFWQAIHVLYGNPVVFLMPSIGFIVSVVTEIIFVIGLYNDNNPNYFPFSNIFVVALFFIGIIITYFQLVITRNIILKKRRTINIPCYRTEFLVIFMIYSIYALILVEMGSLESGIRKSYVLESDRYSLYTFKLKSYNDVSTIVPSGTVIILFSTTFSVFFNSWMVTSISRYKITGMHVFYESLKDLFDIIVQRKEDKRKRLASLFLLTSIISVVGFILTNIEIVPIVSSLNLYVFQFVISNVIGALYSPFFLICLFLILLPREKQTYFK